MNALLTWFLDLLYPPRCMLCHCMMESSERATCGMCEDDLPEYEKPPRKVRFYEKSSVVFRYEGYVADAVRRFKFHGMQTYSQQFAKWMCIRIRGELDGKYDLISWVPCSARRRRKRGFDQAELLAKEVSKQLGVPCIRTVRKIKDTPKQSRQTSDAARRANVLGAYKAYKPENYIGKRILMIDDVLTTGSTMEECGKMLRLAGSGDLVCAAIASAR